MGAELPARMDTEFLGTASRSLVVLGLLPALILALVVRSVGTRLVAIDAGCRHHRARALSPDPRAL